MANQLAILKVSGMLLVLIGFIFVLAGPTISAFVPLSSSGVFVTFTVQQGTGQICWSGAANGCTSTSQQITISYGGTLTVTATSGAGYSFLSWSLTNPYPSGSLYTVNPLTLTPNQDMTVYAVFQSATTNFSIGASDITVTQGSSSTEIVYVNQISGTPTVSLSGNCPSGVTCSFNPSSVMAGSTSTMTATASLSASTGYYSVTITGSSGGITRTVTITLAVKAGTSTTTSMTCCFGMSSSGSLTVTAGNSVSGTVSVTKASSLDQSIQVSLSVSGCPSNTTCSLSATSGSTPFTSTLYIYTTASTPAASYVVKVTGTTSASSFTNSVTFPLTVNAPPPPPSTFDFSISNNGGSTIISGQTAYAYVFISLVSGTAGTVTLSLNGCPPSSSCAVVPSQGTPYFSATVTVATTSSTTSGNYNIVVTGTGGGNTHPTQFAVTVNSPPPPQNFDFSISNSLNGGTATVTYPGSATTVQVTATLTISPTTTVYLSIDSCPPGLTCTINPSSSQPTFTATASFTANANAQAGTYPMSITGTGGGRQHSTQFNLQVVTQTFDFSICIQPPSSSCQRSTSMTVNAGGGGSAQVNLVVVSGPSQTVTLTLGGCPTAFGVACSLSTSTGTPPFSSTLSFSIPGGYSQGSFNLVVTGTGGSKLYQAQLSITVPTVTTSQSSSSTTSQSSSSTTPGCDLTQPTGTLTATDSHGTQTLSNPSGTYTLDPSFKLIFTPTQSLCTVVAVPVVFLPWQDSYTSNPPRTPTGTYDLQPDASVPNHGFSRQFGPLESGSKWFLNVGVTTLNGQQWGLSIFTLDYSTGIGALHAVTQAQNYFAAVTPYFTNWFSIFGWVIVLFGVIFVAMPVKHP